MIGLSSKASKAPHVTQKFDIVVCPSGERFNRVFWVIQSRNEVMGCFVDCILTVFLLVCNLGFGSEGRGGGETGEIVR
jgi:hypothetical protein